jgi:PAS domain S-box-containing protein
VSQPDLAGFNRKLEALHAASLAITADLSLDRVLQRIVDLARELVDATYAALGVSDEHGVIEQFLTSGLTAEQRVAIGPLPRGHGLLGALIRDRRVLRVANIAHDPRSSGFPPHHPPMTNLLGVPLIFQERVVGDLYLTDKRGAADFDDEDVRLISMLAAQAAVAIANARLYEAMQHQFLIAEARRRHLQTIIDSIPDGVVIAGATGQRTMINAAGRALLGDLALTNDGDTGVQAGTTALLHPDGHPYRRGELPLDVVMRERQVVHDVEVVVPGPDGRRRTLLLTGAPLLDDADGLSGAVGVFRDITATKEADQLKDDFLSLVSHELRTPLTTIQGGARTLLRHYRHLDQATMESLLSDVAGEAERLTRLVGNMLDLSRIRAGRLQLATEPTRLEAVIRRAYEATAAKLGGRRVTLRLADDMPPVEADSDRIEQVVRNLMENAAKYVPAGGQVTITTRVERPVVVTTVADTGPGIPTDQLARIFERFHQVEGTSTTGGAGLGLYLSRHLVEAHGGKLWVESQPGRGSAFSFSLPLA